MNIALGSCATSQDVLISHNQMQEWPFQREVEKIQDLILAGEFEQLEKIQAESRQIDATISDGQPRLAAFYQGIIGCSQGCINTLLVPRFNFLYQRVQEWSRLYPQSIAPRVGRAGFFLGKAWLIRGGDLADSVDAKTMAAFVKAVQMANNDLHKLDSAYREDPGWYAAMLEIGLAQAWPRDEFMNLFDEATKKYPFYMPFYFTGAHYSAPRWYGSISMFHEFVEKAVNITRSKWGDMLYTRLNWALSTDTMFQDGQTDWPRMRDGFQRIINDYPDPWNFNHFVRFACLAEDWNTVITLSEKIKQKPLTVAWFGKPDRYFTCVARAHKTLSQKS